MKTFAFVAVLLGWLFGSALAQTYTAGGVYTMPTVVTVGPINGHWNNTSSEAPIGNRRDPAVTEARLVVGVFPNNGDEVINQFNWMNYLTKGTTVGVDPKVSLTYRDFTRTVNGAKIAFSDNTNYNPGGYRVVVMLVAKTTGRKLSLDRLSGGYQSSENVPWYNKFFLKSYQGISHYSYTARGVLGSTVLRNGEDGKTPVNELYAILWDCSYAVAGQWNLDQISKFFAENYVFWSPWIRGWFADGAGETAFELTNDLPVDRRWPVSFEVERRPGSKVAVTIDGYGNQQFRLEVSEGGKPPWEFKEAFAYPVPSGRYILPATTSAFFRLAQ